MRYLLFLFPFWLAGQSTQPLTADFRFADGVYLSHGALMANRPDVGWKDIDGEMVQLAEDQRVQIDGYGYKTGEHRLPYAISLDGMPYLFVGANEKRGYHEFSGLRIRGTYATVQYDTVEHSRLLMKAYNPSNGLAFREGYVDRDRQRTLSRVIDLRNGRRYPLELSAVRKLVAEESDLVGALSRTAPEEIEKLKRALVLFNERHPLLVPAPQTP